ncbi:MAG: N-acetylmuramic acid 6-phosphate etherase [Candidatus Eremiobacteraeota bacterium]|nr:N-acetylmuramic acid 6-phosphate etherase [Candidatus Eremiobacteraeota bacterium]
MSERVPATEGVHAGNPQLDLLPTSELIALLVGDQRDAVAAVAVQSAAIARAVDEIAARLRCGGALHYVGAGTSGRLATLDAAEMPPTFGTAPDLVRAHVAGGEAALVRAIEGAEDDAQAGAAVMRDAQPCDAAVGISASGGAPYVVAAIEAARARRAYTVALSSVSSSRLVRAAEHAIVVETGAEALTGSTRLKAGTAQKIALNAISTAVMVRLGKVYGNSMVDVVANNEKLRRRALRLVTELAGVDERRARGLLEAAGGRVKAAIVMERKRCDAAAASELLERRGGSLRAALE